MCELFYCSYCILHRRMRTLKIWLKPSSVAASGLRTSLLKDVGTRGELENLPFYDEIIICDPQLKREQERNLDPNQPFKTVYKLEKVEYKLAIKESLELKTGQVTLQIIDLTRNKVICQKSNGIPRTIRRGFLFRKRVIIGSWLLSLVFLSIH